MYTRGYINDYLSKGKNLSLFDIFFFALHQASPQIALFSDFRGHCGETGHLVLA